MSYLISVIDILIQIKECINLCHRMSYSHNKKPIVQTIYHISRCHINLILRQTVTEESMPSSCKSMAGRGNTLKQMELNVYVKRHRSRWVAHAPHCSTPLHIALRCYTNKLIGNGRLSLAGEYLQLHVTVGTDDLVMALFPLAVPLGCVLFTRVQDTVCTLFV